VRHPAQLAPPGISRAPAQGLGCLDRLLSFKGGTPTTWVYAAGLSESGILHGIRAGHVYVSRDPSGPRLSFTARAAGHEAMVGGVLKVRREEEITFHRQVWDAPHAEGNQSDAQRRLPCSHSYERRGEPSASRMLNQPIESQFGQTARSSSG